MRNFVPFLLILFVVAAVLRIDFFFSVVYLLAAVYLFSRLWVQRAARGLETERRFTDRAFCGERVPVSLTVRNGGWLPVPWLEVHESLPVALAAPPFYHEITSLGIRERKGFQYTLNCRQRGYYTIGPLTMRTGDLLGAVPVKELTVEAEHIIVYPRVVPMQRLGLPTHSPLAALPNRTPLYEDPARVMGVRDYQRGDSLRRIHWTATASAGRLLVKRYQPAIARETLICLNLNQDDYPQRRRYTATELAIVAAASVANHVITREKLPAGLVTEALDPLSEARTRFRLPPRQERGHLMSVLEVLARAQITPTAPFAQLLRQESVNLAWGATILAITGQESQVLFDTLVYLRKAGFAVALLLVQPMQPSADLQQQADLLGLPVHRVWQARELEAGL
jgi:uncharacterized protein (DUF58 family)